MHEAVFLSLVQLQGEKCSLVVLVNKNIFWASCNCCVARLESKIAWKSIYDVFHIYLLHYQIKINITSNHFTPLHIRHNHCLKRVRIRSYSGSHFSRILPHSGWIRRDTNARKMRTRITSNTDTFYAVHNIKEIIEANI